MQLSHTVTLAAVDTGEIVGIVVFVLYGLFWLFRKLAESKEQQRLAEQKRQKQAGGDEQTEYAADEEQVRRFLESLGARQAPTEQPPPPPGPPPSRPPQPPQPEPVILRPVREKPRAPAPPPRPAPAPRKPARAPEPEPMAKPMAEQEPEPLSVRRAAPSESLALPWLPPLQKAVVLSKILQRRRGPHRPSAR